MLLRQIERGCIMTGQWRQKSTLSKATTPGARNPRLRPGSYTFELEMVGWIARQGLVGALTGTLGMLRQGESRGGSAAAGAPGAVCETRKRRV